MHTFNPAQSKRLLITVLLSVVVTSATPAYAQNATLDPTVAADALTQGFHKERNYFSPEPWERFDLMTGNMILTFTDLELPGNAGRTLRFQRTFNSSTALAGPGTTSRWRFGFPGMVMRVIERTIPVDFDYQDDLANILPFTPRLLMADGSERSTVFVTRPNTFIPETRRWVRSGEMFKYDIDNNELWMTDGTRCHYDADGWLVGFSDPFGNTVSIDRSNPTRWVVTQNLGNGEIRTVTFTLDNGVPVDMEFLSRHWHFGIATQVGRPDIETVAMPEGLSWTFGYVNGDLHTVMTPNGGLVTYEYQDRLVYDPRFSNDQTHAETVHELQKRVAGPPPNNEWVFNYGPSQAGDSYSRTGEITLPSGGVVSFSYGPIGPSPGRVMAGGLGLTLREVRSSAGILLEHEELSYGIVLPSVDWGANPNTGLQAWWGTTMLTERRITRPNEGPAEYRTTLAYDPLFPSQYHRPLTITEVGERTRTTTFQYRHYDTATLYRVGLPLNERIQVSTDAQEYWTFWDYFDGTGAVKSVARPGLTTQYTYTAEGNAATVTDPHGQVTTYTYSYGQPKTVQTPKYTVTRQINADGTMASEARGARTTLHEYDALMRPTKMTPPGGTNVTQTTYAVTSEGPTVLVQRGNSWTRATLDGFGRPIETINSQGVRTSTTYDAEGRVEHEGIPYATGANLWTLIEYDTLDRVRKRTHPDGSYTEWAYGGAQVQIRDENARLTTQQWTAFGHPDDRWLAEVVDAKGQHWNYAYNALGSLKSVSAPDGKLRTWEYSNSNQLIRETHPESGMTQYWYFADLLSRKDDANGNSFTYAYDTNGRLDTMSVGGKSTKITYEPDSDQRSSVSTSSSSSTSNSSTVYVYDAAGRVTERKDAVGAYVFYSRYVYDANDNIVQITYPSQRQIQYEHDSENRVTRVVEPITPPREYASGFSYHPSGALSSYTAGNGIQTVLSYDPQRFGSAAFHLVRCSSRTITTTEWAMSARSLTRVLG